MATPLSTEMDGGVAHDALVQVKEEMVHELQAVDITVSRKKERKMPARKKSATRKPAVKKMVNIRKPKEVRDLERQVAKLEKAIATAVRKMIAVSLVLKVAPAAAKPKKRVAKKS